MTPNQSIRIYKIIIAAIGGQGGNVLAEWLFTAARLAGCEARFFSLPGLAQRGGATNLYIELAAGGSPQELAAVNFSAHPIPGDIDVIIGQELLETGRLLQQGLGSDHTTVLTSTTRILTAIEKMPMSGGVFDQERLLKFTAEFSSNVYAFDALAKVRKAGLPDQVVNSVLYGALCESAALPIERGVYLQAIDAVGVAPEPNRLGFDVGCSVARELRPAPTPASNEHASVLEIVDRHAAELSSSAARDYRGIVKQAQAQYPPELHRVLSEALYQLIDFQNIRYAGVYLELLAEVNRHDRENGGGKYALACTETIARNLAIWMTYEDAIRVADFKTRASRFERIEREMKIEPTQRYEVMEYLKPDAEEIYGIFPKAIVEPLLDLFESWGKVAKTEEERVHYEQRIYSTRIGGYLKLWALSRLRFLRPRSYRYAREMQAIRAWLSEIEEFLPVSYELGCFVAQTAQLVKGYGQIRRRMFDSRCRLIANILRPFAQQVRGGDGSLKLDDLMQHAQSALQLCLKDEHGIDQAEEAFRKLLASQSASREAEQEAATTAASTTPEPSGSTSSSSQP